MEDGYIQSKQRELNEKLSTAEQKTIVLEKRIEIATKTIEDYEQLIAMLKKQQSFNEVLENNSKKMIEQHLTELHKKTQEMVDAIIRKTQKEHFKKIEDILKITKDANDKIASNFNRTDARLCENVFTFFLICFELKKNNLLDEKNLAEMQMFKDKFEKLMDVKTTVQVKGEIKKLFNSIFGEGFLEYGNGWDLKW